MIKINPAFFQADFQLEGNCFSRAFANAGTAFDAISTDNSLAVSHSNSAHRASTDAGFATAAFFAPLIVISPFKGLPPIISYLAKDHSLLVKIHYNPYGLYHKKQIM